MQIDILGCLAGLSNAEVQEGWVDLPYGSGEGEVVIRVMAPMEVLRSRISNIVILKRRDPNAIRQLRLSPHVVEAYIRQQLGRILSVRPEDDPDLMKGLQRSAQDLIRELIRHGRSQELDRIFLDHEVDLLAHARNLADHPAWEPRFAEFQVRRASTQGTERRRTRIAERVKEGPRLLLCPPPRPGEDVTRCEPDRKIGTQHRQSVLRQQDKPLKILEYHVSTDRQETR